MEGGTNLQFDLAGIGNLDIAKLFQGNPAYKNISLEELDGLKLFNGWLHFSPWLRTYAGIGTQSANNNGTLVGFDGRVTVDVSSDMGLFNAYWPDADIAGSAEGKVANDDIKLGANNALFANGVAGTITMMHGVEFGLEVTLNLPSQLASGDGNFPSISVGKETYVKVVLGSSEAEKSLACVDYSVQSLIYQGTKKQTSVGWPTDSDIMLHQTAQLVLGKCYPDQALTNPTKRMSRRGFSDLSGFLGLVPGTKATALDLSTTLNTGDQLDTGPKFFGTGSYTCVQLETETGGCCGCACTDQELDSSLDTPCPEPDCENMRDTWPDPDLSFGLVETRNGIMQRSELVSGIATISRKQISLCPSVAKEKVNGPKYPAFPRDPGWPWEGIEGGQWQGIVSYIGNNSENCAIWTVDLIQPADKRILTRGTANYRRGDLVRANYNSKPVTLKCISFANKTS